MNKKLINITLFTIIIGVFNCCNNDKDGYYFNGNIRYFDNNRKNVKNVTSKSVQLDGVYSGSIAAYDSLLIFWYPVSQGNFFTVFNVDTGKEIGSFCEKGQGPKEAISVNCIFQIFKQENDIMTLLYAPNEGKLFFWNISQSVEKGRTVYDTIVSYKNDRIFSQFYQSEDILFANKPSDYLKGEVSTPFYEKRTIYTNELIRNYPIYKKSSLRNRNTAEQLKFFFYSWDVIKPDGSKIAQAMWHLPQINILDTHTGDIVGYRMKNSPNFSLLETDLKSMVVYYNTLHADNNYIYATYWGKDMWNDRMLPFINTIHVFDWNGKLLYELVTDRPFFRSIWLDQVRNRLYTIDVKTDEVYYLDLDELNLQ